MREMELWKDKIQLRIRDRIQISMEQFTRECLEIDVGEQSDTQGVLKAGSMDKVYERAAKLVKKTLDVEGATVMDVSHFDVLETTKAEGAISIVCHHGDCHNYESISGAGGGRSWLMTLHPVRDLVMVPLIAKEGIESLQGKSCGCGGGACH